MLEEVREAGLAGLLVARADAEPREVAEHRRALVDEHEQAEPVAEAEAMHVRDVAAETSLREVAEGHGAFVGPACGVDGLLAASSFESRATSCGGAFGAT